MFAGRCQQLLTASWLCPCPHHAVGLPPAASAAHYGWLARQYQCAAQMMAGSRVDEATLQVCCCGLWGIQPLPSTSNMLGGPL